MKQHEKYLYAADCGAGLIFARHLKQAMLFGFGLICMIALLPFAMIGVLSPTFRRERRRWQD